MSRQFPCPNNPFGPNTLLYADDLRGGELWLYTARPLRPLGAARPPLTRCVAGFKRIADVMVTHTREVHLHFPQVAQPGELCRRWRVAAPGARYRTQTSPAS